MSYLESEIVKLLRITEKIANKYDQLKETNLAKHKLILVLQKDNASLNYNLVQSERKAARLESWATHLFNELQELKQ